MSLKSLIFFGLVFSSQVFAQGRFPGIPFYQSSSQLVVEIPGIVLRGPFTTESEVLRAIQPLAAVLVGVPGENLVLELDNEVRPTVGSGVTYRFQQYQLTPGEPQVIDGSNLLVQVEEGRIKSIQSTLVKPLGVAAFKSYRSDLSLKGTPFKTKEVILKTVGTSVTPSFQEVLRGLGQRHGYSIKGVQQKNMSFEEYLAIDVHGNAIEKNEKGYINRAERVRRIGVLLEKEPEIFMSSLIAAAQKPASEDHIPPKILRYIHKDGNSQLSQRALISGPFGYVIIMEFQVTEDGTYDLISVSDAYKKVTVIDVQKPGALARIVPILKGKSVYKFNADQDVPKKARGFLGIFKVPVPENAREVGQSLKDVHNYFHKRFGWQSYDGKGSQLTALQQMKAFAGNAAWAMDPFNMFIVGTDGEDLANLEKAIDVFGHEYCHAIISRTARLTGSWHPGAINEHVSDICGVMVRAYVNRQPEVTNFLVGDTVLTSEAKTRITSAGTPALALRDLLEPKKSWSSQIAHMVEAQIDFPSSCVPSEGNDKCGIHVLTGVLNSSVARIMQRIPLKAFELFFFDFITTRLTSSPTFSDYAQQMVDFCSGEKQKYSLKSEDCEMMAGEFGKVGLGVKGHEGSDSCESQLKLVMDLYNYSREEAEGFLGFQCQW